MVTVLCGGLRIVQDTSAVFCIFVVSFAVATHCTHQEHGTLSLLDVIFSPDRAKK